MNKKKKVNPVRSKPPQGDCSRLDEIPGGRTSNGVKTHLPIHPDAYIDRKKLLEYFDRFKKEKTQVLVGVEAEFLGVDAKTGFAIPYQGQNGIEGVFDQLILKFGWKSIRESEKIVALKRDAAEIHLEPGGQLEFSGCPHSELKENLNEIRGFYGELKEVSLEMNIAWLELGMQPFSDLASISWVPKDRYRILSEYLSQKGSLSHRMMKQTATLQANLDYIHLTDAMEKLRTALALAPVMIGLFANSPLLEGRFTGTLSLRAEAWRYTDPDRCGLIQEVLEDRPHIENFLEYLLKIPMIFIMRNGKWIPMHGRKFGEFLEHGYLEFKPTEGDWELFLTSIFTETRLNPFVELRSCDRNSLNLSFGMLAFWKGLLLDEEARAAAWRLLRDWKFEERTQFCAAAAYRALRARLRMYTIRDLGFELMDYAQKGLKRRWTQGLAHEDESIYLEPVKHLLIEGVSPAEKLITLWEGPWNRNPQKLIEYCRI